MADVYLHQLPDAAPLTGAEYVLVDQAGSALKTTAQNVANLAVMFQLPPGLILPYGGGTPPSGYLLCDGSAVSRAGAAALFAAIGTTWGPGDGSTTFNLPDLRGRSPMGAGTGTGLSPRNLADLPGEELHTLVDVELPSTTPLTLNDPGHHHAPNGTPTAFLTFLSSSANHIVSTGGTLGYLADNFTSTALTGLSGTLGGSDGGHNTIHPCAVVNFIIKT